MAKRRNRNANQNTLLMLTLILIGAVVVLLYTVGNTSKYYGSAPASQTTMSEARGPSGGGSGGKRVAGTLSLVNSNPCSLPCTASVHGSGFPPNIRISVGISGDYSSYAGPQKYSDSTGSFDYTYCDYDTSGKPIYCPAVITYAGNYAFTASYLDNHGNTVSVPFAAFSAR